MHISVQNYRKIELAAEENNLPKNGVFDIKKGCGSHLVFQIEPQNTPMQALMTRKIPPDLKRIAEKLRPLER